MSRSDDMWFEPKRFGIGAGWPIVWQGWVLIGGYLALAGLCTILIEWDQEIGWPVFVAVIVPATLAIMVIAKAKTRGGWRWRWGD